ncbi:MAG TPA: UPF0182 family protein, partial [Nocardioidaceae bacterium]|nr:UPF0182 family protein [Nocardioidaceae bacterium]
MSGFFDDEPESGPRRPVATAPGGRSRALAITAVVMIVFFFMLSTFTGVWTDRLWFNSVDYGSVFTKILGTKVLLFVVFGLLFGGFVFANIFAAYRTRPLFRPTSPEQANLDRYRDVVEPMRKWIAIGVSLVLGLFAGGSAAGEWRNFLMWRHGTEFGVDDPYFKRDVGFFVFDLPWLHYSVNVAMTATVLGLLAAAVVHYLFGGIRLQAKGDKLSGAAQVQLSILLGLFVLFKAVDYWLDRFDLTIEQGRRFTGVNYTADHAQLPAKNILMFIAIICAILFFANVFRRTWMLPSVGLGLLVLSAILLGVLWPGIVWQFQVKPSEPDKEAPYLTNNITATRAAYGVGEVAEQPFNAIRQVTQEQQNKDAESLPGVRLIDPALVNQTFEQQQQVRVFYSVPQVLDVDRYAVKGPVPRDVVITVRELDQAGLDAAQRNWANDHTVYTHGYGVIAAFGNNRDVDGKTLPSSQDDQLAWAELGLSKQGDLTGDYEHRIYFGEKSPSYSVVGNSTGGAGVEVNNPGFEEAAQEELDLPPSEGPTTTYDGADGVEIGGIFNKLMYALKFGDANIVLSGRVNENSKILYERHPRERVEKVAPWLTIDNDPYPAIVDGRVVWILDGYTMTDRYPNAQRESLEEMTQDQLRQTTSFVTLPTDQINYVRNSVKATVDAYDGTVTLYEWDKDPILEAWMDVFPGVVKPKSDISEGLLQHLRYPEDMFKVQRFVLAQYHVEDPQLFYQGTNRWEVPPDPADTSESKKQPPYRLSVQMPPEAGSETTTSLPPTFSLTSVYVPFGKKVLSSFIAVNSDASSDQYGEMRILTLPPGSTLDGPSLIANRFAADEDIQGTLQPLKLNQRIDNGNLLTLPVGGGLLYVQPVYASQTRS